MVVLAVDTALDWAAAAVVENGRIVGAAGAPAAGDAEAIVDHVAAALRAAGVGYAAIQRVAVTAGPGSFTGVRVGMAFAKGVALARGIPAVGVSTLEVMARMAGEPVLAAVDARHGAVFAALYTARAAAPVLEGRMPVGAAAEAAGRAGGTIVGPPSAVAALGTGRSIERLDLAVLADAAGGDSFGRGPRALYLAPVDAAPQRHKALARA